MLEINPSYKQYGVLYCTVFTVAFIAEVLLNLTQLYISCPIH